MNSPKPRYDLLILLLVSCVGLDVLVDHATQTLPFGPGTWMFYWGVSAGMTGVYACVAVWAPFPRPVRWGVAAMLVVVQRVLVIVINVQRIPFALGQVTASVLGCLVMAVLLLLFCLVTGFASTADNGVRASRVRLTARQSHVVDLLVFLLLIVPLTWRMWTIFGQPAGGSSLVDVVGWFLSLGLRGGLVVLPCAVAVLGCRLTLRRRIIIVVVPGAAYCGVSNFVQLLNASGQSLLETGASVIGSAVTLAACLAVFRIAGVRLAHLGAVDVPRPTPAETSTDVDPPLTLVTNRAGAVPAAERLASTPLLHLSGLSLLMSFAEGVVANTTNSEVLAYVFVGAWFGQAGAVAIVAALVAGTLWMRLTAAATVVWLQVGAAFIGAALAGHPPQMEQFAGAFALAPTLLLAAQLPVWLARPYCGLRTGDAMSERLQWRRRFHIGDLIVVTTAVAVAISLARAYRATSSVYDHFDLPTQLSTVTAIAFIWSVLVCAPCAAAALQARDRFRGGLALLCYVTTTAALLTLAFIWWATGPGARLPAALTLFHLGAFTTMYASLALIRHFAELRTRQTATAPDGPPQQQDEA